MSSLAEHSVGIWAADPLTHAALTVAVDAVTGFVAVPGAEHGQLALVATSAGSGGTAALAVASGLGGARPVILIWGEAVRPVASDQPLGAHTAILDREQATGPALANCLRQITTRGTSDYAMFAGPGGSGGSGGSAGSDDTDGLPTQLPEREAEVLRMVAAGWNTQSIAEKLFYSERTVKNLLYRIVHLLEVTNRAEAVAVAVRRGLI